MTYLRFIVHGAEGVEKLKRCEDFALDEERGDDGGGRPVSCTGRHLEEPLFERKLAELAAAHAGVVEEVCHCREGICSFEVRRECIG